ANPAATSSTPIAGSASVTCLTCPAQNDAPRISTHEPASSSQSRRGNASTASAMVKTPVSVASKRWVCSTATLPTIFAATVPKQGGQSGQASPLSVLVTTPPAAISTTVSTAAAAASLRITGALYAASRGRAKR